MARFGIPALPTRSVRRRRAVLKKALELLDDGRRWTKWTDARVEADINSLPVDLTSPNAGAFCLRGAVRRAEVDLGLKDTKAWTAATIASLDLHDVRPTALNDSSETQWPDVEKVLKVAIRRGR